MDHQTVDLRVAPPVGSGGRASARGLRAGFWLASPLVGLGVPSLYVAFLYLGGVVQLGRPLLGSAGLVYFSCQIVTMSLVMGVLLAALRGTPSPAPVPTGFLRPGVFRLIVLLGALGAVFTLADFGRAFHLGTMSLAQIRQVFATRPTTAFSYLSNLLLPFSSFALGLTLVFWERLPVRARLAGLGVGIGAPVLTAVGQAGRGYIFDLLILIPWWMLQRPVWGQPVLPRSRFVRLGGLLVLGVGVASLGVISSVRKSGDHQYRVSMGYFKYTTVPSAPVVRLLERLPPPLANGLTEALLYWTHSLPTFDKVYQDWNLAPDLLGSVAPVLSRRAQALGLVPTTTQRVEHYEEITLRYRIPSNGFATVPSALIYSFGRRGGLLFSVLLAGLAAWVYAVARRRKEFVLLYLSGLVFLSLVLWFQRPLGAYPMYEYGVYYVLLHTLLIAGQRRWTRARAGRPAGGGIP